MDTCYFCYPRIIRWSTRPRGGRVHSPFARRQGWTLDPSTLLFLSLWNNCKYTHYCRTPQTVTNSFFFKKISPVIVGAIINKYDNITVSFIIVGVICTVFGFGFCFSPPFRHKDSKGNPRRPETTPLLLPPQEKEEEEVESKKEESSTVPVEGIASDSTGVDDKFSAVPADRRDAVTPMMFWVAVAITTVFICVYTGFEVTFSGLLATYATEVGAASATGAAYMTSAFWGAFAVGRGVSIPLTIFIKPEAYLMIILVISAISILPSIFFTVKEG